MSNLRVTVENGTTREYASAAAAVRALLAELTPAELHALKLDGVRREQLRRQGRAPAGEVGSAAVNAQPYVTE